MKDDAQKKIEAAFAEKRAEALSFLEGKAYEEVLDRAADYYATGSIAVDALAPRHSAARLSDNEIPFPTEGTSPIKEAAIALSAVLRLWEEVFEGDAGEILKSDDGESLDPITYFAVTVVKPLLDDPETSGDAYAKAMETEPMDRLRGGIQCMVTCAAYVTQTIKAEKAGNWDQAWLYASKAKLWAGVILGSSASQDREGNPASALARMRHKENYALRDDVENYWRANIDPALSAQKAAEQVLRANVVPLSFKTIAEIISRVRKRDAERTK